MRQILRKKDLPISGTSQFEQQRDGTFPKYFHPTPGIAAVWADEWERLATLRAAGASKDEQRELVKSLHKERLEAANLIRKGVA